jgi:hypothetical protein
MANAHDAITTPCCFATQPFAECAISAITGASIPRISRYCMGDYSLCPVYKAQLNKQVDGDALHLTDLKKNTHRKEN